MKQNKHFYILILLFLSCSSGNKGKPETGPLFSSLPASETGIDFENSVVDTQNQNIFKYRNFYNGGGVAIGDINNDGKPDIFFTSNLHENKLFVNKGNWKFEDVTIKSGLTSTHHWHTGVTMVDINGDGWLDIYVCNSGEFENDNRANELYINQRNGTFKEEAHAYGLDDKGQSMQAIFFDYDHDGDLDCFVLNNSNRSVESFGYSKNLRYQRDSANGDRLYRNDNGKFVDVSERAGIFGSAIAFGLGVNVGDINNDGWEDIYVSNDFFEKDYLYINQKNGQFKEVTDQAIGHMSQGSMGADMADINNDGYLDIFTTEMLPEDDYRLKTTIKFDEFNTVNAKNRLGYHHQFTTNCLQLNNQDGTFSEVAQLASVDATGWSWGALSFDFDNDGWKDIFVCNGISHDITNQDFLEFFVSRETGESIRQNGFDFQKILNRMPSTPISNYGFLNMHDLRFKNATAALGFDQPSFSNGAAYGDLDGDGDLDLVVNNENMPAFVYRNMTSEKLHHHFIQVRLKGEKSNANGLGARVDIFCKGKIQTQQQMPTRGFESSVDPLIHFGLGNENVIDSLFIQWSGGKSQIIKSIRADTVITLLEKNAFFSRQLFKPTVIPLLKNVTSYAVSGNIKHNENDFIDFNTEKLIPKMLSTEGPMLAAGDVNGDGLADFYMGNAFGDIPKLYIQQSPGKFIFKNEPVFEQDRYFESIGASFLDADGDGDIDLVVASGGNQALAGSDNLLVRLYLNDGKGNFTRQLANWPVVKINASCVRQIDFNNDGLPDLFIGGRVTPGHYGMKADSKLLENKGGGVFQDVTNTIARDLLELGMVTDASPIKINGMTELVIVGDWMPVTFMGFKNGRFVKLKELRNSSGWWNKITVTDLNSDGYPDLIAGNFGLNSRISPDSLHPAQLFTGDFSNNGKTTCIPVFYKKDGKAYPYFMKDELEKEIPTLKKKFLTFKSYAGKEFKDIYSTDEIKKASILTANESETCIFMNDCQGNFIKHPLPIEAQYSPVYAIIADDFNNDGLMDIFLAGNFYGVKPQMGRFDAGYGALFLQDKSNKYIYQRPLESGIFVAGEARDALVMNKNTSNELYIISRNNDDLLIFKKNARNSASKNVPR